MDMHERGCWNKVDLSSHFWNQELTKLIQNRWWKWFCSQTFNKHIINVWLRMTHAHACPKTRITIQFVLYLPLEIWRDLKVQTLRQSVLYWTWTWSTVSTPNIYLTILQYDSFAGNFFLANLVKTTNLVLIDSWKKRCSKFYRKFSKLDLWLSVVSPEDN